MFSLSAFFCNPRPGPPCSRTCSQPENHLPHSLATCKTPLERSTHMRSLFGLALGVLLAAVAVGIKLVPALQQTGITQTVVRSIIVALILVGLWRGLALQTRRPRHAATVGS